MSASGPDGGCAAARGARLVRREVDTDRTVAFAVVGRCPQLQSGQNKGGIG